MKINERFPPELLNVLTHFYRGELQRSTDWRTRLDTTTNWAIIAMTATFSWAFRSVDAGKDSHIAFFFTSLIVALLLAIESRRYRYFDAWRTRVRMLEVHLLMPALNPEIDIVQGDWREVLSNDLLLPSYKISFREALGARLRANYIWILLGLLVGWILRIYTGAYAAVRESNNDAASADVRVDVTFGDFYDTCGYGVITPLEMILGFAAFWIVIVWVLITTWRDRRVTGEIRRRDRKARQWPI